MAKNSNSLKKELQYYEDLFIGEKLLGFICRLDTTTATTDSFLKYWQVISNILLTKGNS